jgi:hypothetical protein
MHLLVAVLADLGFIIRIESKPFTVIWQKLELPHFYHLNFSWRFIHLRVELENVVKIAMYKRVGNIELGIVLIDMLWEILEAAIRNIKLVWIILEVWTILFGNV